MKSGGGTPFSETASEAQQVVGGFIECCVRECLPEEVLLKVLKEGLLPRAHLWIDSLLKSPLEFWKAFNTFLPALENIEPSEVLDLIIGLWKKQGELCRLQDGFLAQRLMNDVCLKSLLDIIRQEPTKTETLCDLIYGWMEDGVGRHTLCDFIYGWMEDGVWGGA